MILNYPLRKYTIVGDARVQHSILLDKIFEVKQLNEVIRSLG